MLAEVGHQLYSTPGNEALMQRGRHEVQGRWRGNAGRLGDEGTGQEPGVGGRQEHIVGGRPSISHDASR